MRIDILTHGLPVVKNQLVAEILFEPGQVGTVGMSKVEEICHRCHPVIDVLPFRESKIGIVIASCNGFSSATLEMLACLRRRIAELGSVVVSEQTYSGETDAEATVQRLSECRAEMLVMVGMPVPGEKGWPADRIVSLSGGSTAIGQISLMPISQESNSDLVPVLCLSGSVLNDRGLIADVMVPRFLAGLHVCPGEGGREYDRAGNVFPPVQRMMPGSRTGIDV
jgi:hypothetical protein